MLLLIGAQGLMAMHEFFNVSAAIEALLPETLVTIGSTLFDFFPDMSLASLTVV